MGDIEDGGAELLLDALQLEAKVGAQLGVERGERLVHQVDRRLAHQGATDGDALHLAARQPGRRIGQLGVDAQQLGNGANPPLDLVLRQAAGGRAQRERQVVEHREVGIERVLLKDEGDVAGRRRCRGHVMAGDGDSAGIGPLEPGDQPQGGGLAGPGRAEQHDELAVADRQAEIADRDDLAEPLGDPVEYHLSHGRHPRAARFSPRGRTPRRIPTGAPAAA